MFYYFSNTSIMENEINIKNVATVEDIDKEISRLEENLKKLIELKKIRSFRIPKKNDYTSDQKNLFFDECYNFAMLNFRKDVSSENKAHKLLIEILNINNLSTQEFWKRIKMLS